MIFLKTDKTNKVTFIHYMPFDKTNGMGKSEAELRIEGHLIDSMPTPQTPVGKIDVAYYTPEKGVWYEYESQTSELDILKATIKDFELQAQLLDIKLTIISESMVI